MDWEVMSVAAAMAGVGTHYGPAKPDSSLSQTGVYHRCVVMMGVTQTLCSLSAAAGQHLIFMCSKREAQSVSHKLETLA